MKHALGDLLASKKFLTAVVAFIVAVAGKFGFDLDEATVMALISPFLILIPGQGIADIGKEKAKVEAALSPAGEIDA